MSYTRDLGEVKWLEIDHLLDSQLSIGLPMTVPSTSPRMCVPFSGNTKGFDT